MESIKGQVSLREFFAEIEAEVEAYEPKPEELTPVAVQPGDEIVGVVADNEEVKKLFALKNKYDLQSKKYGFSYQLFGGFPAGVEPKDTIVTEERAEVYETAFWALVRRLTGQYGVALAIREGWQVAVPVLPGIAPQVPMSGAHEPVGRVN